eukprot:5372987-Prymnesium_polylepis.1
MARGRREVARLVKLDGLLQAHLPGRVGGRRTWRKGKRERDRPAGSRSARHPDEGGDARRHSQIVRHRGRNVLSSNSRVLWPMADVVARGGIGRLR